MPELTRQKPAARAQKETVYAQYSLVPMLAYLRFFSFEYYV